MRLTIDPTANAAYLRLKPSTGEVTTIAVSDDLNVDVGADGSICGIEFLDAAKQVLDGDDGRIIVVDDETEGVTRSIDIVPGANRRRARAG